MFRFCGCSDSVRVYEEDILVPYNRALQNIAKADAMKAAPQPPPPPPAEGDEDQAAKESQASPAAPGVISDAELAEAAKGLDAAEKKKLAAQFTATATADRKAAIREAISKAGAEVYRNRVVPVPSVVDAKIWMEGTRPGFSARTVVVDVGMDANTQSGPRSRSLAVAPSKERCEVWSKAVKELRATPILGHVLIRGCQQHGLHHLHEQLENTHKHARGVIVPICVPPSVQAKLNSAQSRAFGPSDDRAERGGVDFSMRSIGRVERKGGGTDVPDGPGDDEKEGDDEECEQEISEQDREFLRKCDPELLGHAELKHIYGDILQDAKAVMFQASTRITPVAAFMTDHDFVRLSADERGLPTIYRKAQVHPEVYLQALNSALGCSAIALAPTECLVTLTGGTPEVVTAAIIAGYQRVVVVCGDANEYSMYQMPTSAEEHEAKLDYVHYASPDPLLPLKGILAAATVRQLMPYIENAVHKRPSVPHLHPGIEIHAPPMVSYMYYPVTNSIVQRVLAEPQEPKGGSPKKRKPAVVETPPAKAARSPTTEQTAADATPMEVSEGESDDALPETGDDEEPGGDEPEATVENQLAQLKSLMKKKPKGKKESKEPKEPKGKKEPQEPKKSKK